MHKLGKYLGTVVTFALVLSLNAEASPQQPNIKRLFEAMKNIVKADSFCEEGYHDKAETRLRVASYRIRIVLADIRYTSGLNKAVDALEIANEKVVDPYLGTREKVDIALDCMSVAMPVLFKAQSYYTGPTRAALQHIRLARLLTDAFVFSPVRSVLQKAKRYLQPVSCPIASAAYAEAKEAINIAIEKINDPYLSLSEKEYFVVDCLQVAREALKDL